MFLFDTNVLSELMKPSPDERVFNWVEQQLKSELFVSAVTRAEIERGIAILPDGRRKQSVQSVNEQGVLLQWKMHKLRQLQSCIIYG